MKYFVYNFISQLHLPHSQCKCSVKSQKKLRDFDRLDYIETNKEFCDNTEWKNKFFQVIFICILQKELLVVLQIIKITDRHINQKILQKSQTITTNHTKINKISLPNHHTKITPLVSRLRTHINLNHNRFSSPNKITSAQINITLKLNIKDGIIIQLWKWKCMLIYWLSQVCVCCNLNIVNVDSWSLG